MDQVIIMTGPDDAGDAWDTVKRYAPTAATLAPEWQALDPHDLASRLVAGAAVTPVLPLTGRASRTPGHGRRMALLASAAAVVLAVGVLTVALTVGSDRRHGAPSGAHHGRYFTPPPGLSDRPIGMDQYDYRQVKFDAVVDSTNKPIPGRLAGTSRPALYANGTTVNLSPTGSVVACGRPSGGRPSFAAPTRAFVVTLPTDYRRLAVYLRAHRELGTAKSAIGTFFSSGASGLASTRLRAAMIAVLSRQSQVTIHWDTTDEAGRTALRLDVPDRGATTILYFDPVTYRLLESRFRYQGTTQRKIVEAERVSDARTPLPKACK